jgi:hypothetical protein
MRRSCVRLSLKSNACPFLSIEAGIVKKLTQLRRGKETNEHKTQPFSSTTYVIRCACEFNFHETD